MYTFKFLCADLHAVGNGKASTHRRNQRRKRVHRRFERKTKMQELKIKAYRRKVSLPRKNVTLGPAVSTVRMLPDFECGDVPLLPEGAVLPLNNSSESIILYIMPLCCMCRLRYIQKLNAFFFRTVTLGSGTFGSCHTMWFSGLTVAVKVYHHKNIRKKHIEMEARMLQVNCSYVSTLKGIIMIIIIKLKVFFFMYIYTCRFVLVIRIPHSYLEQSVD